MTRRINGVEFSAVTHEDFSVEYDLFMNRYLSETGVTACLAVEPTKTTKQVETPMGVITIKVEDEGEKSQAERLIESLEASPKTPHLLAGLIKAKDERWSLELALATEAIISTCTKPNDKLVLFEMLMTGLSTFFTLRKSIMDDFPLIIATGVTGRITEREPPEMRGFKQYGQWDDALRVLAGYNPDIVSKELRWHLRDFLLAYEYHIKQRVEVDYKHQMSLYAVLAPYAKKGKLKPPKIPRVLRGRRTHGNNQE
jgi:hypothetical protein